MIRTCVGCGVVMDCYGKRQRCKLCVRLREQERSRKRCQIIKAERAGSYAGDLSPAEIERRYQQRYQELQYARRMGQAS